ncbi:glycosyltransferase family 2 protein [Lentzea sp. NPDC058436]|uniref:glycosyltransferase family 2 protein n=1 Tax=Lentzea sp. NPDC058436 TaxID=3346499 RepID=UPI00365EC650
MGTAVLGRVEDLGARRGTRPREPRISVIVPARNEARNLELILPALPSVHEVIVVEGSSHDDTIPTVRRILPFARLIRQTRRGKGNALVCGFTEATGDIVVMFDADGSADAAEIPAFVEALVAGADFAKGSRVCQGGGSEDLTFLRSFGNRMLTLVTNVLFRTRYTDLCYGYNAFWVDVLPRLNLPDPEPAGDEMRWGDGFEIETVLNTRVAAAGLRVAEVPSVERLRVHGASNLHAVRDGFRVLGTILSEWRGRARLATVTTTRPVSRTRSLDLAG